MTAAPGADPRMVEALAQLLAAAWRKAQVVEPELARQPNNPLAFQRAGHDLARRMHTGAELQERRRAQLERGAD